MELLGPPRTVTVCSTCESKDLLTCRLWRSLLWIPTTFSSLRKYFQLVVPLRWHSHRDIKSKSQCKGERAKNVHIFGEYCALKCPGDTGKCASFCPLAREFGKLTCTKLYCVLDPVLDATCANLFTLITNLPERCFSPHLTGHWDPGKNMFTVTE